MTADRTRFRSISGIDRNHKDSGASRFVFEEGSELVEAPRIMQPALRSADSFIRALSNAGQILNGNRGAGGFCGVNDSLAYGMVNQSGMGLLAPTKPLQGATGILASAPRTFVCLRLQGLTNFVPFQAIGTQSLPTETLTVTQRSNITNAKIDTEHGFRFFGFWRWLLNLNMQIVPGFFLAKSCRFWIRSSKCVALKFSEPQKKFHAKSEHGETNVILTQRHRKNPGIIVNACWEKFRILFLAGRNASDGTNGKLGTQSELLSNLSIAGMVKIVLPSGFECSGEIASVRECFERSLDVLHLRRRHFELTFHGTNHN